MKFGTRWFFDLLKPNLKSDFLNSEKGSLPSGEEGGEGGNSQNFCFPTDFDQIWYNIVFLPLKPKFEDRF